MYAINERVVQLIGSGLITIGDLSAFLLYTGYLSAR
jgi:hypothetical protein